MSHSNRCFSERHFIDSTKIVVEVFEIAGLADHSGIVSRERERRDKDLPAVLAAVVDESLTQRTIGGNASGYRDLIDMQIGCRFLEFAHEDIDHRSLQRSTHILPEIWNILRQVVNGLYALRFEHVAQGIKEGGLEAGEGVIVPGNIGFGKGVFGRVAELGEFVYPRASRIRKTEHFRTLIESLAGSIVDGLTDDLHVVVGTDENDLGVTTRNEQAEERKSWMFEARTVFDKMREHMALQMVHIDEGNVKGQRQPFGKRGTDEQGAQESGSAGEGDGGNVVFRHAGTLQSGVHDRQDILLMGPAGEFRNDPSVFLMHFLTRDDIATQHPIHDDSRRGIIAAGFDCQYYGSFFHYFQNRLQRYDFFLNYANLFAHVDYFLYLCTLFEIIKMFLYFLIIRIAALFGHAKARAMVRGQKATWSDARLQEKGAIWIHAASVGEFEQARPLIERLRREQPSRRIVLTFFSPSGYEMRKQYDKVDAVAYLPFATRRNARRFIEMLQPAMAIFVKYEFWPPYLKELKRRGIATYSISAIFRPTQRFFHWYGKASLGLLHCFTHIFVQDEASRALLEAHGVKDCSVAGDTRFDRVEQIMEAAPKNDDPRLTPIRQFIEGCERVIVAGSTWPKDEKLLMRYIEEHEDTKLLLVPHEIGWKRQHYIFNLFQGRLVRYSRARQKSMMHMRVMVIDTMGLLSSVYRFGQVAYVGGGFGVGIHNTIEAAVYGVPVVFGPNYHHFREAQGLIDAGAARSITDYPSFEAAMDTALADYQAIGTKAAEYVASEIGATDKIFGKIFS